MRLRHLIPKGEAEAITEADLKRKARSWWTKGEPDQVTALVIAKLRRGCAQGWIKRTRASERHAWRYHR